MSWKIVADPQGANSAASPELAENKGGMVIYLVENSDMLRKREIGRVAFERANSKYPRVPYDVQLDKTVEKARKSIQVLNDLMSEAGELI